MFITTIVIAVLATLTTVDAAPAVIKKRETITYSTSGTYDGYYFQNYIESGTGATLTLNSDSYTLGWDSAAEDVVAGIGWNPGAERDVSYSATVDWNGDSLLALYGWTTNPLVEYYVIESYGTYNPGSAGTYKGSITSDGSTYGRLFNDLYEVVRSDAPSIEGTSTFNQYLSIRQSQRTSGTITFANHVQGWADVGMDLGTWNLQIMATEGYESSGETIVTVQGL